ncbi:3-isopropylmalate dehydratase large subunit [Alsobacter sp. SYSU M60028]|uniref:3-isopropylmalate dehydratase large subunit n=1 Tax=Alsobacter ponti TaxID=2962936 RepID=A0ABT1LD92_9HYPH|nr:3-isopropylmalate dehydratase large subunit [Alsobacter ponti]MCP8939465.1 3-isopropylmalate dehydratase large subunit [Alsobacter ponti]
MANLPHSAAPRTMFDKVWDRHVIVARDEGPSLIYIDRDIIHEGSFHAFADMKRRGYSVRRPRQMFGTPDHYVPTTGREIGDAATAEIARMIRQFDENMDWGGIRSFRLRDPRQGIVHVVGPEQGITLPGLTIVCSDSHTSTHGALGAIAFGIGQSENMHVMATQTLWQARPKTMRISVSGTLARGVHAKDVILAIIGKIGAGGAGGHAIEYAGPAVRAMSIEQRLTICNMSIEAAARCGMVAPDDTTFQYLHGRPFAPSGEEWDRAVAQWRALPTDDGARFDTEVALEGHAIAPMVTWGTSPEDTAPITGHVPDPAGAPDAGRRESTAKALNYMGLTPGTPLADVAIDRVFIGSCTNSRLEDLRAAAEVLRGRKAVVPAMVVPGSTSVKRAAEAEGLDRVFREAGFEWRESGCSMCAAMNGDFVKPQERCASTSNRNFIGRQGPNARTHLMSPAMAAAAAVTGRLTDVRRLLN